MMQKKNIVLFDMDNTLVSADTIALWSQFLDQKGMETDKDKRKKFHADYDIGQLDFETYFRFELSVIKKIPALLRDQWRCEFFEEFVKPKISTRGLRLITNYKQQADTLVILITATLAFVAGPVATFSGWMI